MTTAVFECPWSAERQRVISRQVAHRLRAISDGIDNDVRDSSSSVIDQQRWRYRWLVPLIVDRLANVLLRVISIERFIVQKNRTCQ